MPRPSTRPTARCGRGRASRAAPSGDVWSDHTCYCGLTTSVRREGEHMTAGSAAASDAPRAWQSVLEHVEAHLLDGTLTPGDRLPGERALSAELGVGRSSVRE